MALRGSRRDSGPVAQARPGDTDAATLYAVAADVIEFSARCLWVCNTSGSAAAVRVFFDADGTTYDESTALVWDFSINTTRYQPFDFQALGVTLRGASGGSIGIRTDTADALTFTLWGDEVR